MKSSCINQTRSRLLMLIDKELKDTNAKNVSSPLNKKDNNHHFEISFNETYSNCQCIDNQIDSSEKISNVYDIMADSSSNTTCSYLSHDIDYIENRNNLKGISFLRRYSQFLFDFNNVPNFKSDKRITKTVHENIHSKKAMSLKSLRD